MVGRVVRLLGVIALCCSIATAGVVPVAAVDTTGHEFDVSLEVPDRPTAGESAGINASITIPDLLGDYESQLNATLYVNGTAVANRTTTVADGQTTDLTFDHTFTEPGPRNVTVESSITIGGQTFSDAVSVVLDVAAPTREGVAFDVPPGLEDEVSALRSDLTVPSDATAFVLAQENAAYIVFTETEPTTAPVRIDGVAADATVQYRNLTLGAIVATDTAFNRTPTTVSVRSLASNTDAYALSYVRTSGDYRRVSTLTDPDAGQNVTLPTTVGTVTTNATDTGAFLTSTAELAGNLTRRHAINNTTTVRAQAPVTPPGGDGARVATIRFATNFWADAPATVDGIVLPQNTTARAFVQAAAPVRAMPADDSVPLVYATNETFDSQSVDSINTVRANASDFDGTVVSVNASLFQNRVSVQETLEEQTGCSDDVLLVPTPNGAVCLPVVQDTLLHGGIAWDTTPPGANETLLVLGASSRHQDEPVITDPARNATRGRYRIVGEVVTASRVDGRLPDRPVLVVYELERRGDLQWENLSNETRDVLTAETEQLRAGLTDQLNDSTATLQVPAWLDALEDDSDGDLRIGDFEVLDAIEAWRNGELSDFEVLDVIRLWREDVPITEYDG